MPVAFLDCGSLAHLMWDPSGNFLAGTHRRAHRSLIISLKEGERQEHPYQRLGPWSPTGTLILARTPEASAVLTWPGLEPLAALPKLPWAWLDDTTLLAPNGPRLWKHDLRQGHVAYQDGDSVWKKLAVLRKDQATGLRWRPSLKQVELMIWEGEHRSPFLPRFPDLAGLRLGMWAWSPDHSSWAAAGGDLGRHLWAWTFPQGWMVLEHESDRRILSLEHTGKGLTWLDEEGLQCHDLETQLFHFIALETGLWPGALAWSQRRQQLAVAGRSGIHLFQPNP